jgi:deoxyribodipyrimidine photo-lyase
MLAIHWLRRDLRLADNPALANAAERAQRLCLVYFTDSASKEGAAALWWRNKSLAAFRSRLEEQGQRLLILEGPVSEQLPRLAAGLQASLVTWNRIFEPDETALEQKLLAILRAQGVDVFEGGNALLFPPSSILNQTGQPFRVFTPFWRACRQRLNWRSSSAPPATLPPPPAGLDAFPETALPAQPAWARKFDSHWTPGEAGAGNALSAFIQNGLQGYANLRDRPDIAGTSRLSAHLHWGEITPSRILSAIDAERSKGQLDETSVEKFLSELGWREFCHHLLEGFPKMASLEFQPRFRGHPWKSDPSILTAWQKWRTGIPFVDAGMRELWATGWMHNRVRMVAASFLVKQLQIDWRLGLAWFQDTLVDADLANNAGGWQWVAGTGADAAPHFRIFNPVLQGEKFDPTGAYVRKWVPEIAHLPDRLIHKPWLAEADRGGGYPPPLVDLKSARNQALAARKQAPTC